MSSKGRRAFVSLPLPELGPAPSHDFALADQLGAELAAVKRQVYIKINPVKGPLGGVHALEIRLQILARQVGRKGYDLLDAYTKQC